MSLQIGKAIYEILHSNTDIVTKLNDKIFPLIADVNTSFPFIIYKRTSVVPVYTKDRYSKNESVSVQIVIASDKYFDTVEISDLVRTTLEGKMGTFSGIIISDVRLDSADEDFIEDTFIQTLTFNITTNG